MITQIKIALRNLNRQKKRSFLLGGAIAFGIFIISMINGFTGSFVSNAGENFSQLMGGHIFVEGNEKTEGGKVLSIIRNDTALVETVAEENLPVTHITRVSEFQGTLIFGGKSLMQSVISADWEDLNFLKERIYLKEGSFENMQNPKGLIISHKVAQRLNVQLYDTVLFRLRTISGQQNVGDFEIAGINYDSGLVSSMSAYANLAYVNELLDIAPHEYQMLGLFLEDIKLIDSVTDKYMTALEPKVSLFNRKADDADDKSMIEAMMSDEDEEEWEGTRYRIYTLNDVLVWVQEMVNTINSAGLIVLLVLFSIVVIGISNTFRMIMIERIKEIGTMRALGMQRSGIRSLFLLEALFLSLGGAVVGLILAGIAMWGFSLINWGLDTPLFIFLKNGHMTFYLKISQILLNVSIIALLTILAAFFPARKAARLQPTDALRAA